VVGDSDKHFSPFRVSPCSQLRLEESFGIVKSGPVLWPAIFHPSSFGGIFLSFKGEEVGWQGVGFTSGRFLGDRGVHGFLNDLGEVLDAAVNALRALKALHFQAVVNF